MAKPIDLILLYGGKSGEHEISLRSAASILKRLDNQRYNIIPLGIDKEGCCYVNDYHELFECKDSLPVKTPSSKALPCLVSNGQLVVPADVVFPVLHGPLYEDGALQGLLTMSGAAFVGSPVLSSAIGMDKDVSRRLACDEIILSAKYRCLSWFADEQQTAKFCEQVVNEFGWPLFVKPLCMGSSVGVHKVNNREELDAAIVDARRYDETIIVESFVKGREIELAVLENNSPVLPPRVSVPGELKINHPDGFYSYAAKYLQSDSTEIVIPAALKPDMVTRLQAAAAAIFVRLKCKGMARIDFFVNEEKDEIYFNEINTLPGFTSISMYPKLWEASGINYALLLDELIGLAMTHHACRKQLVTDYQ